MQQQLVYKLNYGCSETSNVKIITTRIKKPTSMVIVMEYKNKIFHLIKTLFKHFNTNIIENENGECVHKTTIPQKSRIPPKYIFYCDNIQVYTPFCTFNSTHQHKTSTEIIIFM